MSFDCKEIYYGFNSLLAIIKSVESFKLLQQRKSRWQNQLRGCFSRSRNRLPSCTVLNNMFKGICWSFHCPCRVVFTWMKQVEHNILSHQPCLGSCYKQIPFRLYAASASLILVSSLYNQYFLLIKRQLLHANMYMAKLSISRKIKDFNNPVS